MSHFGNKSAFEKVSPVAGFRSWSPGEDFAGNTWLAETRTEKPDGNAMASGETVARPAKCLGPFHVLLRANRTVVLAVLWAALAVCIVGALAFDVAGWLSAWMATARK